MRKARRGLRGAAGHAGTVNDNSDLKSESDLDSNAIKMLGMGYTAPKKHITC